MVSLRVCLTVERFSIDTFGDRQVHKMRQKFYSPGFWQYMSGRTSSGTGNTTDTSFLLTNTHLMIRVFHFLDAYVGSSVRSKMKNPAILVPGGFGLPWNHHLRYSSSPLGLPNYTTSLDNQPFSHRRFRPSDIESPYKLEKL